MSGAPRAVAVLALAMLLVAGSGCGTIARLVDGDVGVFAGVRSDLGPPGPENPFPWFRYVDLPFSFVLDMLLVPLTLFLHIIRGGS